MIILGVDTSLRSTGYAVLETVGSRFRALDFGNIPNSPKLSISGCLLAINTKISELCEKWQKHWKKKALKQKFCRLVPNL